VDDAASSSRPLSKLTRQTTRKDKGPVVPREMSHTNCPCRSLQSLLLKLTGDCPPVFSTVFLPFSYRFFFTLLIHLDSVYYSIFPSPFAFSLVTSTFFLPLFLYSNASRFCLLQYCFLPLWPSPLSLTFFSLYSNSVPIIQTETEI